MVALGCGLRVAVRLESCMCGDRGMQASWWEGLGGLGWLRRGVVVVVVRVGRKWEMRESV